MDNIELYINNKLCDVGKNFSIRLRRQIINPAELNTKDAQASYSITLPITPNNDHIFNYTSLEETKRKFNTPYEAELFINTQQVFKGNFRVSEIDKEGYKGNLLIPVPKTVKDIFGEAKMTETPPFLVQFGKFAESVNYWNQKAKDGELTPCIFPYVLYGLLSKVLGSNGEYSAIDVWDDTVRIGITHMPPSVNVMQMLQHIFKEKKFILTGTAPEDERLKALYMSYKNEPDYLQHWNWGDLATIKINGEWSMADYTRIHSTPGKWTFSNHERQIDLNSDEQGSYYSVNLFHTNRATLSYEDTGANVFHDLHPDKYVDVNYMRNHMLVKIPQSGYYKIKLTCPEFKLMNIGEGRNDSDHGNHFTSTSQKKKKQNNRFDRKRFEIQVMRDYGSGDFKLNNIVGTYHSPQFPQDIYNNKNQYPKFYPFAQGPLVVDPSVNENFICGLHWGRSGDDRNPQDDAQKCNYMFIQNGLSWDKAFNDKRIHSIYDSHIPGQEGNYWCWGDPATDGNDDDEPSEETTEEEEEETSNPEWFRTQKRYAKLHNYESPNYIKQNGDDLRGEGTVECAVWLQAGEYITVGVVGDLGDLEKKKNNYITYIDKIKFSLEITPWRTEQEFGNFDSKGSYDPYSQIDWAAPCTFQTNKIDLAQFLPADTRVDEFITEFCKAFNLKISQTGEKEFSLDLKQQKKTQRYDHFIDLDHQASVSDATNQTLDLPSAYRIGFTIDEEEQGYKDNWNDVEVLGIIRTGALEDRETEQKSKFSANWFKSIRKKEADIPKRMIFLPVISKLEVWIDKSQYAENMGKCYTNLAQRFWYFDGLLTDSGVSFGFGHANTSLLPAKVSNTFHSPTQPNVLNYENKENTILTNYFSLLTDADSHYTVLECHLRPDQYEELGKGAKVRFNGDLYYVAEIDGYDPLNKNKTTLKLIRVV